VAYAQVLWKIGRALLLLIPILVAGWKIIPRVLFPRERFYNDEISLLLALTLSSSSPAITELVGPLSLASGQHFFSPVLLLGNSDSFTTRQSKLCRLRDAFVAHFFSSPLDCLIDPYDRWLSFPWRLVVNPHCHGLSPAVSPIWSGVARLFGYSWESFKAGSRNRPSRQNRRILVHPAAQVF